MELCLVGYGVQSPTGTDAPMSIANVYAGISRISKFEKIVDKNYEPVSLGIAGYLKRSMSNKKRIQTLLVASVAETLQIFSDEMQLPKLVHLIVGLPNERPGLEKDLEQAIGYSLDELSKASNIDFSVEFIRRDHDSGLVGLKQAEAICRENTDAFVAIACVDSFVSKKTIQWLEQTKALYCSANKRGFTPGEAAACCLVCTEETAEKYRLPTRAKIVEISSAMEPSKINKKLVNAGKGLTEAMSNVLKSLPEGEAIQEVVCTLKGLRGEAQEYGLSHMAVGRYFSKPGEYVALCHRWGDVGAASATALLTYVAEKRAQEFSGPGYSLIFTISPGASRSAALVRTL